MAHLPDDEHLAPDRAAQDEPEPVTPTDEDVPTPDLDGMTEDQDDEDVPAEPVTIPDPDLPITEDDVADALAENLED